MNITYLLGAGASANCLPVINELPDRLAMLRAEIFAGTVDGNPKEIQYKTEELKQLAKELCKDIDWLLKELNSHKTIDTLAKKFYLQVKQEESLLKLKKIMIVYFLYEQAQDKGEIRRGVKKELPDKRYDSLIATIIDNKRDSLKLPSNFKIITWNYDIQFELAYNEYLSNIPLKYIQNMMGAIPTPNYLNEKTVVDLNQFSFLRLNGVAGFQSYLSRIDKFDPESIGEAYQELLANVVTLYAKLTKEDLCVFNYAWETAGDFNVLHGKKEELVTVAQTIMQQTDILVVIGYSFPNFNRSVDRKFLDSAFNLQKVYVQDLHSEDIVNLLRTSFSVLKNKQTVASFREQAKDPFGKHPKEYVVEIETIQQVSQFFIPPEAEI